MTLRSRGVRARARARERACTHNWIQERNTLTLIDEEEIFAIHASCFCACEEEKEKKKKETCREKSMNVRNAGGFNAEPRMHAARIRKNLDGNRSGSFLPETSVKISHDGSEIYRDC